MTDRIRHITITLDRDLRDDDAKGILDAIGRIKGVATVEPRIVTGGDILARAAVAAEIGPRLYTAIAEVLDGKRG